MFSEDRPQLTQPKTGLSRDQRKHIRLEHSGTVQFISEGRQFSGQAVNISRSGMQVVVNVPDSYQSVRSITFTLPNSDQTIELPCRIVRSGSGNRIGEAQVLGLEFSYQGEAQLLLIENFIREMKKTELAERSQSSEMRQIPRADCSIRDTSIDRAGVRIISIDNISTGGLLVSYEGELGPSDDFDLEFRLPLDSRKLRLHGRVAYVIDDSFCCTSTAGIFIDSLRETDRARIRNFIVSSASGSAMRNMHTRYSAGELDQNYLIKDRTRITNLLTNLQQQNVQLNVLFEESLKIIELHLQRVDPEKGIFTAEVPSDVAGLSLREQIPAYSSFYLDGGSHYFKCRLEEFKDHHWVFTCPEVIMQSEKRSYQRKVLEIGTYVEVFLDHGNTDRQILSGRLIDISRRGFLCEVSLLDEQNLELERGQPLQYAVKETLGLDSHGVIRHLAQLTKDDGTRKLRIGIEAGIRRQGFQLRYFSADEWANHVQSTGAGKGPKPIKMDSIPIRYRNKKGQEIAALANATRFNTKAAVVVLPPAFGKKKEALSPLAATLLTNFQLHGKDVVTIRYDGINRPGESHNDEINPRRGYEMLHYRLGQGQEDLRSTLDFVYDNPYFTPEKVILVTFSMSALDARRLLSSGEFRRVNLWISCMGIPAAQSSYGKILGGMDIVGNYKLDMPNGVGGVLGQLIDLDTLAKDLIINNYAYITDARLDMSKIPIPVLWIYGAYDNWLVAEEIKDIMSIKAQGTREVIEIPTGHNLRSSEDAITNFKLISAYLFEKLYDISITPIHPDREEMLRIISYERDRVSPPKKTFSPEVYWKKYLIGHGDNSSGYDFYSNFEEFRKFLNREVELIEPEPGERIADMGCGTGLFLESLLDLLGNRSTDTTSIEIVAVDFVEEALAKAQEKCRKLLSLYPNLDSMRMQFKKMDLDPNRLIPVHNFINDPQLDYNSLRNRIEGLRNVTVDFLNSHPSRELDEIMRGKEVDEDSLKRLDSILHDGHRSAVLDFNRAARYLLKRLEPSDIKASRRKQSVDLSSPLDYSNLCTHDLHFEVLSFGHSDLNLSMGFESGSFTKIVASLFISYLFNPELVLSEFYDMLAPGGMLLVSSMKPDSDISTMYTKYIENVVNRGSEERSPLRRDQDLSAARAMLNEAASLFTLEEEGYFQFYSSSDLIDLLKSVGFERILVEPSLGLPPQAVIATGMKPKSPV